MIAKRLVMALVAVFATVAILGTTAPIKTADAQQKNSVLSKIKKEGKLKLLLETFKRWQC